MTNDLPLKPRHSDIDAWGVTHTGKVRKENQDHFFLGSMSRGVVVDITSIPEGEHLVDEERLATFAMVGLVINFSTTRWGMVARPSVAFDRARAVAG